VSSSTRVSLASPALPTQRLLPLIGPKWNYSSLPASVSGPCASSNSARSPPLAGLEKAGVLQRVSAIEDADICYWDAQEGDDLDAFLEAALELCAEMKVPLLHANRSADGTRTVADSVGKGSAEAAAARLERLGGRALAAGKLDGCAQGLGWAEDLVPRDVLLVTPDLGDVAEAAKHGVDVILQLGSRAEAQLSAFRHAREQKKAAERKHASVSQRMAEDSPAMLHAASNPFFSVFKLPSLLAEASRKNAEHRARVERAQADAVVAAHARGATDAEAAAAASAASRLELQEDPSEALRRWCDAMKVPPPAALLRGPVRWDLEENEGGKALGSTRTTRRAQAGTMRGGAARAAEPESVDDILQQLKP